MDGLIAYALSKKYVDGKTSDLATGMSWKGTKENISNLPQSGNKIGDLWHVNEDGNEYAWDGSKWEALGGRKEPPTVDSALSDTSENPVQNKVVKAALDEKGTYSKPGDGIPKLDLAQAVQMSLGKADTALQSSDLSYVTPEQYGAVGDGVADDTAAVRAALKDSIESKKILLINKPYYITASLLTNADYSHATINIIGNSPLNKEQYAIDGYGGVKFENGVNVFDGLTLRGSIQHMAFMPVSRTQTGSIFHDCTLSKFTFDACFVSNILAFFHNTNVTSTSHISRSTFLTVYYFSKCDAGDKYCTDSIIENNYINGGMEMNNNNCFEWYNYNGSIVTGNFIDYYRTIYAPIHTSSSLFQCAVSTNNQYQVFRYFYYDPNAVSFHLQSDSDCFNWTMPSSLDKLAAFDVLTYTGHDGQTHEMPPYILGVFSNGAVEINHAVIQNNIGNIVFIRHGLGTNDFARARMTCSLANHRREYADSVTLADSVYCVGAFRDNLIDIPFTQVLQSLPVVGVSSWSSTQYPGMRVAVNKRVYRYKWFYNGSSWYAKWVDETLGATSAPKIIKSVSDTSVALDANIFYAFPEMDSLAITLNAPNDNAFVNEYQFMFDSGVIPTLLTLPSTVIQPNGFTVEANTRYRISIIDNCMTVHSWDISAKLPLEYQRVEYIEMSGTQYIVTQFIPTNNPVCKAEYKINANQDTLLFGMSSAGEPDWTCGMYADNNASILFGRYGTTKNSRISQSAPKEQWNTLVMGKDVYVNGVKTFYFSAYDFSENTKTMALFARTSSSSAFNGQLKFIQFRNGGEIAFNGVPCYRKSDNEIGIYDTVSETFLTNAGSGVFGKGVDV